MTREIPEGSHVFKSVTSNWILSCYGIRHNGEQGSHCSMQKKVERFLQSSISGCLTFCTFTIKCPFSIEKGNSCPERPSHADCSPWKISIGLSVKCSLKMVQLAKVDSGQSSLQGLHTRNWLCHKGQLTKTNEYRLSGSFLLSVSSAEENRKGEWGQWNATVKHAGLILRQTNLFIGERQPVQAGNSLGFFEKVI